LCLFAALAASPVSVLSQSDSISLHFTLTGWADDTWLLLEDRDAVGDGRLSAAGILQRFHEKIDSEYHLDIISNVFSPVEEFAWYNQFNGLRWRGGSINRRDLIDQTDVRVAVGIGGSWRARVLVDNKNTPILARSSLRLALEKGWRSGIFAFAEGSFHEIKPSSDIAVGGGFRGKRLEASASFVVIDAFNGVVSQLLRESHSSPVTSLDHERQPLALRTTVAARGGTRVRGELHAAVLFPTTIRVADGTVPDSGFRQEERFGYVGVLGEWSLARDYTVGAFATYVRAAVDRRPLPLGLASDDFRLVQRTTEFGGILLARPFNRWLFQNRIVHSRRPELRTPRSDSVTLVDWEDRAWSGQAEVTYMAPRGFIAGTAFEWDLREVVRGNPDSTELTADVEGRLVGIGQVPSAEFLGRDHTRVRFEIGWIFLPGRKFTLGFRIDVDGDKYAGDNSPFDGAHGRFEFTW
jgi:hypothetical protein